MYLVSVTLPSHEFDTRAGVAYMASSPTIIEERMLARSTSVPRSSSVDDVLACRISKGGPSWGKAK